MTMDSGVQSSGTWLLAFVAAVLECASGAPIAGPLSIVGVTVPDSRCLTRGRSTRLGMGCQKGIWCDGSGCGWWLGGKKWPVHSCELCLLLGKGCRSIAFPFLLCLHWAQGSDMTGLVALEALADRYALPVEVGVFQLKVLDMPKGCPVFRSVCALVCEEVPEIDVI